MMTTPCVLSFWIRGFNGPVIIASSAGGMDIESVSQETPHLIKTIPVDILMGVTDSMAENIADFLQFEGSLKAKVIIRIITLLWLEHGLKRQFDDKEHKNKQTETSLNNNILLNTGKGT